MKKMRVGLAGMAAVAAFILVAACDQNTEEQASSEAAPEVMAEMAESDLPDSQMPETTMPESDLPEAADGATNAATAAENGEAEFNAAVASCQAAADALGVWVGQPFADAEDAITAGANVANIRVIHRDTMVTKDFRPDRLNVDVNEEGNVTRVYCG